MSWEVPGISRISGCYRSRREECMSFVTSSNAGM
jgi:hypothetical protein